jgi:hypothetical protein
MVKLLFRLTLLYRQNDNGKNTSPQFALQDKSIMRDSTELPDLKDVAHFLVGDP